MLQKVRGAAEFWWSGPPRVCFRSVLHSGDVEHRRGEESRRPINPSERSEPHPAQSVGASLLIRPAHTKRYLLGKLGKSLALPDGEGLYPS